jgi:hypothetical protein
LRIEEINYVLLEGVLLHLGLIERKATCWTVLDLPGFETVITNYIILNSIILQVCPHSAMV